MAGLPPFADAGLGRSKKGIDFSREAYVLGTIGTESNILYNAAVGASQVNTTLQGMPWVLPGRIKVPKIAVYCSAIGALTGYSFNIVVGTGAYTQGSVAGNDNSSINGFCTNPAVAGNALFAADVPLVAASFINGVTIATGTGFGSLAGIVIPTNPDAVYGAGSVLTLRVTTPAGGSITNFTISAYTEPQPLSAYDTNPTGPNFPSAGINF